VRALACTALCCAHTGARQPLFRCTHSRRKRFSFGDVIHQALPLHAAVRVPDVLVGVAPARRREDGGARTHARLRVLPSAQLAAGTRQCRRQQHDCCAAHSNSPGLWLHPRVHLERNGGGGVAA
jgi:hypothetical protein